MEIHFHRATTMEVQTLTSLDGMSRWTELVITDDEGKMDRIVFFPAHKCPPPVITAYCPPKESL